MEETKIKYDEELIKEIKKKISKQIKEDNTTPESWAVTSLQYCTALIEDLIDENNSLWFMLEEMKESVWKKENSKELNEAIQKQLAMLKLLQGRKVEA
jgi:hypoxanthine-guanine phosphoribosyltransferase